MDLTDQNVEKTSGYVRVLKMYKYNTA